jgi:hypothetical protein
MNKKITSEMIMSWYPCENYSEDRARLLIGDGLTPLEICDLDLPAIDILWILLRKEIIPEKILSLFSCRCAEDALSQIDNPDPRSMNAIRVKRLWLDGKATDYELHTAIRASDAAANASAGVASILAFKGASEATGAWIIARAAAWVVARAGDKGADKESREKICKKYLKWVKEILEKIE